MGYIGNPEYLLLKTNLIYTTFYKDAHKLFKHELDIVELVNQAIDSVTNDMYSMHPSDGFIVYDLLRQRALTNDEKLYVSELYYKLCRELRETLKELNASPIIDTFNGSEVYPYYFYKIISNKIILKRF